MEVLSYFIIESNFKLKFRLGHSNSEDKDLLKEYFEAVDDLSSLLEKHLGIILLRAFATVRKNPHELVTGNKGVCIRGICP